MQRHRLGCLSGTGIFAALIAVLSIAGYGFAGGGVMFSPGPLNAVAGSLLGGVASHAEIDGNCRACHTAPWEAETMDQHCLMCHANVAAELSDLQHIHGRLMRHDPTATCRECHPEHQGEAAPLTVLDRWKFPHEVTGYSLTGHPQTAAQEPFQCGDCHGSDITVFEQSTCQNCHNQIDNAFMLDHVVTFGDTCLDCHDGGDRFGNDFSHNVFPFKLDGKHAALACSQCHFSARTVAELQATKQDCFSCHQPDDPHQGSLGTDCASCHSVEGWKTIHFDHNRSVFKLTGAHLQAACSSCHPNNVFRGTPQDCLSCHRQDEPHEGRFGLNCADCHSTAAWSPAKFDHNLSVFKLTGAHVNVVCEACHVNKVYRGTPQDCFSCHKSKDAHQGQFGTLCSQCHETSSWKNIIFDHNSTSFALRGGHTNVQCAACHTKGVLKGTPKNCFACHAADDQHAGQFGTDCGTCHNPSSWRDVTFNHTNTAFPLTGLHTNVACRSCHVNNQFKGTPQDCFSCHAIKDVHQGQFGTDCGSCHKTTGWQNVTFDHNKTAFPLADSHANAACKSCHVNNVYKGTPQDCYSCHAGKDAHNGQFGTACGSCHKPTSWQDVTFNHNNTAFPLTGSHANAACKSCHVNNVFKGTPTDCYSCHASKDAHNGQFGTACGSCHKPTTWQDVTFNHNNTAFPLAGKHTAVACRSCHVNGVYQGTPTDCYSCHAGKDAHGGQFGTNCGACHNPSGWKNATFDHGNTGFPLVGKHSNLECTKCHRNGVYQGTPAQCVACHEDKHNGANGTDCGSCHTPTGWGNVKGAGALFDVLMRMDIQSTKD